jgi:hypothetical protein
MPALSGKVAKVKVTAVTPTSSTDNATTKLSSGVYQITNVGRRHIDREATAAPVVTVNSTIHSSTRYSINYVEGIFTWAASSQTTGAATVLVDHGYLTASYLGQTKQWSADINTEMNDVTAFATAAASNAQWRTIQPGLSDGTVTLSRFHSTATSTEEPTFFDRLNLGNSVVIDCHMQDFERLVGFGYVEQEASVDDIESPLEETVTIRLDGPMYYTTSS